MLHRGVLLAVVVTSSVAARASARYAVLGIVDKSDETVRGAVGSVRKMAQPLMTQTEVWEPRIDNGYPNVIVRDDKYELYYGDCVGENSDCSIQLVCYAESADGLTQFEKPTIGAYDLDSVRPDLGVGRENNIVLQGGGVGVTWSDGYVAFGDFCVEGTADAGLPGCPSGFVAVNLATSTDGVSWSDGLEIDWPAPQRYDCHNNVFRNDDGEWIATTRNDVDDRREIAVASSEALDAFDTTHAPNTTLVGSSDHQVYSQITFQWHGLYLGLVAVYDSDDPSSFGSGKVRCKLAYSTTATSGWAWVADDEFIPLGHQGDNATDPRNAFDSHVVFAARPVDDGTRIYYMGGNGPHSGDRNSSLGLALLEPDRFAALAGTGLLETRPVFVSSARLALTLDVLADDGCVFLREINHTTIDHAVRLCGANLTDAPLNASLDAFLGAAVPFKFELRDAALYTLSFLNDSAHSSSFVYS